MTSEQAQQLMDNYSIGLDGGPEILSDWDLRNGLKPTSMPIEETAYVVKVSVRHKANNHMSIYQISRTQWNTADEGGKALLREIARLNVTLGLLRELTSEKYPV